MALACCHLAPGEVRIRLPLSLLVTSATTCSPDWPEVAGMRPYAQGACSGLACRSRNAHLGAQTPPSQSGVQSQVPLSRPSHAHTEGLQSGEGTHS